MDSDNAAVAPGTPPARAAPDGLTSDEAFVRLRSDGPIAVPGTSINRIQNALAKFWAPILWLLAAAIVLQVGLPMDKDSFCETRYLSHDASFCCC
jgi:H+-transporting ATPase